MPQIRFKGEMDRSISPVNKENPPTIQQKYKREKENNRDKDLLRSRARELWKLQWVRKNVNKTGWNTYLRYWFGTFRDSMLRQFTRENKANSGLNLARRDGRLLGVCGEFWTKWIRQKNPLSVHVTHLKPQWRYARRYHWRMSSRSPSPCWRYQCQGVLA